MLASLRILASPSAKDTASKMRWPYSLSSVNLRQGREGGREEGRARNKDGYKRGGCVSDGDSPKGSNAS